MDDTLLTWHAIYAVGHPSLDAEHERLLAIINRIREAESDRRAVQGLISLSHTLYLAAMEHFRHENSVMRDIVAGAYLLQDGCENMSEATVNEHCAEHAHSLIELESMLRSYGSDQVPQLAARLRDWFLDHAEHHDAHLRKFFSPGEKTSRDRAST